MIDDKLVGTAGPTLLDVYEAGKEILRSSGTDKQVARRLVEANGSADVGIFMRLLNGDFNPRSDDDLREIASIVQTPHWFTESEKTKDATSQVEKYFTEIGKPMSVTHLRAAYNRMQMKF
jgi:hypothetical protein